MEKDEKYNGWMNYETWVVNLWITDDSGSVDHYNELASECMDAYELSMRIKDEVEDNAPEMEPSLYTDLLTASMSMVNWVEIAEHFMENNS